jgi:predicted  nucleic acid-binding Zn-ribbon protein
LPFIALIAMGAGGVAAIAISNEPQTSSLQQEVVSLRSQIAGARQELASLQQVAASSVQVRRLGRTVAGLERTVSGLQSSAVPVKSKVQALSVCIPQLQGELASQSIHGSGKKASLVSSATISPGCAAVLGGG